MYYTTEIKNLLFNYFYSCYTERKAAKRLKLLQKKDWKVVKKVEMRGAQCCMESIYGAYRPYMEKIMGQIVSKIEAYNEKHMEDGNDKLYEHLSYRIKSEESMRNKLTEKHLPLNEKSALREVTDSIGLRVVCLFMDDVYENVRKIKDIPQCRVVKEKDYIVNAKPNGYRSYHMILDVETEFTDVDGNQPGHYFVEIQLRTIAMDTWAALEHELKYKRSIENQEMIIGELRRCANELASCDVSMQTLRQLIRE